MFVQIGIILMMILGVAGSLVAMCGDLGERRNGAAAMDLGIAVAIMVTAAALLKDLAA